MKKKKHFLNPRTMFLFPVITKLLPIPIYTFESSQTIHQTNSSNTIKFKPHYSLFTIVP